jgi:hypothetical protein
MAIFTYTGLVRRFALPAPGALQALLHPSSSRLLRGRLLAQRP